MIVYSANLGGKDRFREPRENHDGVEYVYFVHDKEHSLFKDKCEDSVWDVRVAPRKYGNHLMDAKWYKMHPHLLFPGEDTVWCDSLYVPGRKTPLHMFRLDTDLIVFRHGARGCLFEEAQFCIDKNIGVGKDIQRQMDAYKKRGMPEDFGLFEGNVLYRKPGASKFNEEWWKQVNNYSTRDQIAMPYVLWRHDISFMNLSPKGKGRQFMKGGKHLFHGTREYEDK
jgi:hypothetical protein